MVGSNVNKLFLHAVKSKITIDNIEVPVVDGCARFSRIEKSKGLKKIRARAILPNIETGERHSIISEFEYHVLPKCSRDCQ